MLNRTIQLNLMGKVFMFLFLFGITACTTKHATNKQPMTINDYSDQASVCPVITKSMVEDCQKNKGNLQKQGRAQCYQCTINYEDAGRVCSDDSDCLGNCYRYQQPVPINVPNQTGICAPNNQEFGCHQRIQNGMATDGMLCID